jgi:hypothetical protein
VGSATDSYLLQHNLEREAGPDCGSLSIIKVYTNCYACVAFFPTVAVGQNAPGSQPAGDSEGNR